MDPRYKSPTAEVADSARENEYEFRDLSRFTSVLNWMLRIGAILAVLGLWSAWMQLDLLSHTYTPEEAAANDRREGAIGGLSGLLMLATFFVFGRWIVLAHRNLPALGAQYLEYRPGWAVGWFFIPIGNLWKPYQAMRSLWRSSRSVHNPDSEDSTWVLPAWWTLWLVSTSLGNVSWRLQMRANTIEQISDMTRVSLAASAVDLLLCVVASLVVSRIWQAQAQQHEFPEEAPKGFADTPRTGEISSPQ